MWGGKKYKVLDVAVLESDVESLIGKVKTQPYSARDDSESMTYYDNASNVFPIGTPHYEIKDVATSEAIAVKSDNQWMKAVYTDQASFHIINIVTNPIFILC